MPEPAIRAAYLQAGQLSHLECQVTTMVDFEAVNFPVPPPKAVVCLNDLPKYEWNHNTRYWWETRISKNHLFRPFPRNDVLGVLADWSNELEPTWRTIIRTD